MSRIRVTIERENPTPEPKEYRSDRWQETYQQIVDLDGQAEPLTIQAIIKAANGFQPQVPA